MPFDMNIFEISALIGAGGTIFYGLEKLWKWCRKPVLTLHYSPHSLHVTQEIHGAVLILYVGFSSRFRDVTINSLKIILTDHDGVDHEFVCIKLRDKHLSPDSPSLNGLPFLAVQAKTSTLVHYELLFQYQYEGFQRDNVSCKRAVVDAKSEQDRDAAFNEQCEFIKKCHILKLGEYKIDFVTQTVDETEVNLNFRKCSFSLNDYDMTQFKKDRELIPEWLRQCYQSEKYGGFFIANTELLISDDSV